MIKLCSGSAQRRDTVMSVAPNTPGDRRGSVIYISWAENMFTRRSSNLSFSLHNLLSLFLVFATLKELQAMAQTCDRTAAFEMNQRLNRGVNMANAFEGEPTETSWGNPWKPEYFKIMADLGFKHVRLPIRWELTDRSMPTPPYTINGNFMHRIQEVVDEAIKNGLYIIINMQHHEALYEDPEGQKDRFLSMWGQIGEFFRDYSDSSLLFEVLNEPHGNFTPEKWNVFFQEALAVIRKTNPTRMVLLGVAEYGGLGGLVHLNVPKEDDYLILSIHYYSPFDFTHQGAEWVDDSDRWLGTKWHDTETDRETVKSEFIFAKQFAKSNNIPIHVGEFGAYKKADMKSRGKWTTFLARWFEEQEFSWCYWDFSAGFGLYDPETKQLIEPIANALFVNEMPDPTPAACAASMYSSDFSTDKDGWTLNTQQGAAGLATVSADNLHVSLSNGGSETWHAQLVKNGITLEQSKTYHISVSIKAATKRSATFYVGRASDPWNAYGEYKSISITDQESTFVYSFTMNEATDNATRLVFDLGQSTVGVIISNVNISTAEVQDDPVPGLSTSPYYNSDFSTDTDGWSLNTQQGAAGSISVSADNLHVSLTNSGSEAWHAQLVKNGITLAQGSVYRVSFTIKATSDRSATFYIGKASEPWNAYGGYSTISITDQESSYVYSLKKKDVTDAAARLVFDLGRSTAGVTISNVKVEPLV